MSTPENTVRCLLAEAGLAPSDAEVASLTRLYARHKAGIESMYAIPAARYESPALIFNPTPVFADWSD